MKNRILCICFSLVVGIATLSSAEINRFAEQFALGDRQAALKELIPGTNDYYFYHALDAQHRGDRAAFDNYVTAWQKQFHSSSQRDRLKLRQALIDYDRDPKASVDYLVKHLGIRFHHQAPRSSKQVHIPSSLNQDLISYAAFLREAQRYGSNSVQYIKATHLCDIDASSFSLTKLRDYLRRLPFPRAPKLIDLLVKELNDRHSSGFGSLAIHKKLLLSQLQELRQRMPQLASNDRFINAYVTRLQPRDGSDWEINPQTYAAYLLRLSGFVSQLPVSQNSLKAHVLYHQLTHQRRLGQFSRELFTEYIKLPRSAQYMNKDYVKKFRSYHVNLRAGHERYTKLPRPHADAELINAYLNHFFMQGVAPEAFHQYLDERYVERLYAETKVLAGDGDQERWASVLGPERYRAIQQRVELRFTAQNKLRYKPGEAVALQLRVKNIEKLLVRVYPINTAAWYRDKGTEIPTDFDVDGLVTKYEQELNYEEHPAKRHIETINLPSIKQRGVYVVECIGNGYRCRSVLRIGNLIVRERVGTAGHVFRVYNDEHKLVKNAAIEFGNQHFTADAKGGILVPFATTSSKSKNLIVKDGSFSVQHRFEHKLESYDLRMSAYIDQQHALAGRLSQLIIRPRLFMHQNPVSLADLEDLRLVVTAKTMDGIEAREVLSDPTLNEIEALVHEFRFPERVVSVKIELFAEIEKISVGTRQKLKATQTLNFNGILRQQEFKDLYLQHLSDGYVIDVLGRNGETYPDEQVVTCNVRHRLFTKDITLQLRTDKHGRISLGTLKDIERVSVNSAGVHRSWHLETADQRMAREYHVQQGETLALSWSDAQADLKQTYLYSLRGEQWTADYSKQLRLDQQGRLVVPALTAGDYELFLPHRQHAIRVVVEQATKQDGQLFSPARIMNARVPHGLQLGDASRDAQHIKIPVYGAGPATRVHVLLQRFQEPSDMLSYLADLSMRTQSVYQPSLFMNNFLDMAKLSDEHRYILDRRYEAIFPTLSLKRPALLLNPWERSATNTRTLTDEDGEGFGSFGSRAGGGKKRAVSRHGGSRSMTQTGEANYDFMANGSVLLHNLAVSPDGFVRIPVEMISDQQHAQVLAIEPEQAMWRQFGLNVKELQRRERRFMPSDKAGDTQEQKLVRVVGDGADLVVNSDPSSWRFLASFSEAYDLLDTLCSDKRLENFQFLKSWPTLSHEEKDALYSEHASHELHLFTYYKDRPFFDKQIKSALANKHDKTFVDLYLLEADLSSYLRPWAFQRLNAFEQALLLRRMTKESASILRSLNERNDLRVFNAKEYDRLFMTALHGKAMNAKAFMAIGAAGKPGESRALRRDRGLARKAQEMKEELAPSTPQVVDAVVEEELDELAVMADEEKGYFSKDRENKKRMRRLYRQIDQTKEWAENNYYKRYPHEQLQDLVKLNAFWLDWAQHKEGRFLSQHFALAHGNAAEVLLALAIMDFPFKAEGSELAVVDGHVHLQTKSPGLLYNIAVSPATLDEDQATLLMKQQLYRLSDRYRYEGNQRIEKYIKEHALYRDVYGMQLVVTNPSARPLQVEILRQIPAGAIALAGHKASENKAISLSAYSVRRFDVLFYFPEQGQFRVPAASASANGKLIGRGNALRLQVLDVLPNVDTSSWAYIADYGTDAEVLQFLSDHNVHRLDLERIAFRMHNSEMFVKTMAALRSARQYVPVLWSYAFKHRSMPYMRDWLEHHGQVIDASGAYLSSTLLQVDAIERLTYEHLEYYPLVNARTHALAGKLQIANDSLAGQYAKFLNNLHYLPALRQQDHFVAMIYLLSQDRFADAIEQFKNIDVNAVHQRLQYDYAKAYLALLQDDMKTAARMCKQYETYALKHWRDRFLAMQQQINEVSTGEQTEPVDDQNRNQDMEQHANNAPVLSLDTSSGKVVIHQDNISSCVVKLYRMDLELLFSNNPFMRGQGGQFAYIEPNHRETIQLKDGHDGTIYELPAGFEKGNVMIEIEVGSLRRRNVLFVHQLQVLTQDNYAQLQVKHKHSGDLVKKAYVKVYARTHGGAVKFYKDGYTDFRGRFDYGALSTSDLDNVQRFALYISHPEFGALVKELDPPQR